MTPRAASVWLAVVLLPVALSARADAAHDWLAKIDHAARTLNYDGVFIYQHDDHLESMRIFHAVTPKGGTVERLLSLNGVPREIVRDNREVRCYLPGQTSIIVEHRKADAKPFPPFLPPTLSDLDKNYVITLGRTGRVAEFPAQLLVIKPRDDYRYGYHVWADRKSGLLVKAVLIDEKGKPVEQFMFTQLRVRKSIPPEELKPQAASTKNGIWRRDESEVAATQPPQWRVTQLPPGFTLSHYLIRRIPGHASPVEHLVFTDGLAAVSVFVEKTRPGRNMPQGPSRIGAVHAYGKLVGDHQVTVVGEVPALTVSMIGNSVQPVR